MQRLLLASLATAAFTVSAYADDLKMQSLDGTVTFSGSFGLTSVKANELVYGGKTKISQLIWKSDNISTFNGGLKIELPKDFYLNASGVIGFGGDGHMADFDWFKAHKSWADRSLHPDTRLNHYFVASVELGRMLISRDGTDIGFGAGFKYTDIKWSAWGGSYIYSEGGFRNTRGEFDPDEKGISYRQSLPMPYLGINITHVMGDWTFSSALQGGFAVNPYDIDDHWVRNLRFYDYFDTTPAVSTTSSVDYAVWNNASVYFSSSFDKMFRVRGDTKMINTNNGRTHWFRNGAGGDYRSMTIAFGLRGKF